MAKALRAKDIYPLLDYCDNVIIWQNDAYTNSDEEEEEIYRGSVMDIPMYIGDMYLYTDMKDDISGLRTGHWKNEHGVEVTGLIINVVEEKENLKR